MDAMHLDLSEVPASTRGERAGAATAILTRTNTDAKAKVASARANGVISPAGSYPLSGDVISVTYDARKAGKCVYKFSGGPAPRGAP